MLLFAGITELLCNPMHVYLKVSPIGFTGIYSQENWHRITAFVYYMAIAQQAGEHTFNTSHRENPLHFNACKSITYL